MNKKYEKRWIGLQSKTIEWAPNSPDMPPLDYGLWPYLLETVRRRRGATSRDELKFLVEEFLKNPLKSSSTSTTH